MDFIVQFAQPLRDVGHLCTGRIYTHDYRSSDLILGDFKRDWVKDDDSSAQLPSVSDSSRSTTTPLSIIDRQQYPQWLLPTDGSGRAYSHRNTHGSHTLRSQPSSRLNDTAPVLNHSTCQPVLHEAG